MAKPHTYRLVESVREGHQVKQRALLNLGADFAIEPQHWRLLTARIEQLLQDADSQQEKNKQEHFKKIHAAWSSN